MSANSTFDSLALAEARKEAKALGVTLPNNVTGKRCIDVPFAYLPWWEARNRP